MIVHYTCPLISRIHDPLLYFLNRFSSSHPILGRVVAIPIGLMTATLFSMRLPLRTIEDLALTAINLIGAPFHEKCSLKDAKFTFTESLEAGVISFVFPLLIFPLTMINVLMDPEGCRIRCSCDSCESQRIEMWQRALQSRTIS